MPAPSALTTSNHPTRTTTNTTITTITTKSTRRATSSTTKRAATAAAAPKQQIRFGRPHAADRLIRTLDARSTTPHHQAAAAATTAAVAAAAPSSANTTRQLLARRTTPAAAALPAATRRRRTPSRALAASGPAPSATMAKTYQSAEGRPFNFSAGPATLPIPVLEQARDEMMDLRGTGISINEISHRSKAFEAVLSEAERDLRALLAIPSNYKVLFMQGGASTQFACLPLNLTKPGDVVDYVVTGAWSKKAYEEAGRFGVTANLAAKSDGKSVPAAADWKLSPGAKFVHYCDNETIGGVEFHEAPQVPEDVTLVADMSSDFLSKPVDVSK
jgi:hypothetical protein